MYRLEVKVDGYLWAKKENPSTLFLRQYLKGLWDNGLRHYVEEDELIVEIKIYRSSK